MTKMIIIIAVKVIKDMFTVYNRKKYHSFMKRKVHRTPVIQMFHAVHSLLLPFALIISTDTARSPGFTALHCGTWDDRMIRFPFIYTFYSFLTFTKNVQQVKFFSFFFHTREIRFGGLDSLNDTQ